MTEPSVVDRAVSRALSAVGARQVPAKPRDPFYDTPTQIPNVPGTVLKAEPSSFYIDPLRLIRVPGRAQRIMFASTDRNGRPIPVTGTVLTPRRNRRHRADGGLIAFAVGTQGMGRPVRTLAPAGRRS